MRFRVGEIVVVSLTLGHRSAANIIRIDTLHFQPSCTELCDHSGLLHCFPIEIAFYTLIGKHMFHLEVLIINNTAHPHNGNSSVYEPYNVWYSYRSSNYLFCTSSSFLFLSMTFLTLQDSDSSLSPVPLCPPGLLSLLLSPPLPIYGASVRAQHLAVLCVFMHSRLNLWVRFGVSGWHDRAPLPGEWERSWRRHIHSLE